MRLPCHLIWIVIEATIGAVFGILATSLNIWASWGSQDWQTRVGLWEICATDEALPFEETDFCYEWGDETFDENNIPFADIPTVIHMTRFFAIMADISSLLAIIFLSLIPLSRYYRQRPGIMAFISLNVAFLFSILAVAYFAEEFPKYTRDKFSKRDPRFDVSFGFQIVAGAFFAIAATHLIIAWLKWRSDVRRGDMRSAGKLPYVAPRAAPPPPPPPSSTAPVNSVTYSTKV